VKEGTTWIKATAGNYSSECTVTVSKEVPCSSIEIKKNDPALICETTLELKAKLGGPPTKTDTLSDIQWTSSNPEIASVNSKGVVCGNKEGTVVITACIRGLSVDYPLVITKGEWADISIGEVCVDSKFFYYSGVEYKEIPFDNDIGLTLVQSDSDVGNRVKFKNIKKPHLIFANITTESVKGQELTIELMGGTENTINGMVYPKSVKFTGKGNLHINNDNDCCIETKEGPLYFESGNIYLHRDNLNYYAMRSAEVIMSTVNAKIYIRGSSKQYYCADYNNYLEPGTVITTTYSGRTSLSEIKIKGADSRISVGKWRLLDCYGKYGNEEKYVNRKYVSWTSSNPEIATMDKDGYLDAIAPGVVTISAYYGGKKTAIKVEVIEDTTVDLSDGDLYIWDGYYTRELGGREIPFDGDAGIEIKQSGSDIGKIIVIESLKDVRLILNGVNAEFSGYWDANLILQLKDGTENYGTGMIYGAGDLMIEGAGKLDMKCDGVSVDVRGSISIEDADVTFENVANGYRTAMSYREDLLINGDGHLTMIVKSSDGVKIEADMEAYIEEGKLEVIVK